MTSTQSFIERISQMAKNINPDRELSYSEVCLIAERLYDNPAFFELMESEIIAYVAETDN